MPRVIGIDPGTVSIDICGLENGRVVLDESHPTSTALRDPAALIARLEEIGPVDLVAGPSGYGLPCVRGAELTETDLRLAYLAAEGESGGIGGLRTFARTLAASRLPVLFTPAVIHLASVPAHRKVNRVDMGTAEKVCAVALAIHEQAARRGCSNDETTFILLELGGAFTAAVAVEGGRIVDGLGGSSGPIGFRGSGALDGEVAFLAGRVSKSMIFAGGAAFVAGERAMTAERLADVPTGRAKIAWDAFIESAVKAIAAMHVSAPGATDVVLSGRVAGLAAVQDSLTKGILRAGLPLAVEPLKGFCLAAKQGAQGAAMLADGLSGGVHAELVATLGIREARGTVLDYLYVISRDEAEARLGIR